MLLLMLSILLPHAVAQVCDVDMIENHAHFTRIKDKNMSRECWFDTPEGADLFLDIERYSDSSTLDHEAFFNITIGDITINIHNAYVKVDKHLCAVPMRTKLEQTIWLHLHFENNEMTLQVSPANTAFFGHCFTVSNVEKSTSMHMVGSTRIGMEQVLRGVHTERPALQDPGQTVIMRKTIHELERRLHVLEKKQEETSYILSRSNKYHSGKHKQHRDLHTQYKQFTDNTVQKIHNNINTMTRDIHTTSPSVLYFCVGGCLCLMLFGYRLWVIGATQKKLTKFKL